MRRATVAERGKSESSYSLLRDREAEGSRRLPCCTSPLDQIRSLDPKPEMPHFRYALTKSIMSSASSCDGAKFAPLTVGGVGCDLPRPLPSDC